MLDLVAYHAVSCDPSQGTHMTLLDCATQEGQPPEEEHNPWAHCMVMWGNLLYEASQMYAAGGNKDWKDTLDAAVEKFRAAGCPEPDIQAALRNHTEADQLDLPPVKVCAAFSVLCGPAYDKTCECRTLARAAVRCMQQGATRTLNCHSEAAQVANGSTFCLACLTDPIISAYTAKTICNPLPANTGASLWTLDG